MSLLLRVIMRNNTLVLLPALFVGTGIYLLTDLFERLDNFIDAELALSVVATYFLYKTPLIISQILPVVFLLATVIQLCIMIRNRELTALYAGGVSPFAVLRMLFICGVLWGGMQFGFSQWLGVQGDQQANRIWQEQIHNRNVNYRTLMNVWFTEQSWIVSLGTLRPDDAGDDFLAYRLSEDGLNVEERIEAATYTVTDQGWLLTAVQHSQPTHFSHERVETLTLDLKQDVNVFRLLGPKTNPQQLSVVQLGRAIESLQASGSNVEVLRTAWHAKIAYAASLAVLTLVAMAIATWRDNIYVACGVALVVTFIYYAIYTVSGTMGQQGLVPPFFAAWMANIVGALLAFAKLAPILLQHKKRSVVAR